MKTFIRDRPILTGILVLLVASFATLTGVQAISSIASLVALASIIWMIVTFRRGRAAQKSSSISTQSFSSSSSFGAWPTPAGSAFRIPISPKLRFDVLVRDNYTCQYCGAKGPQAGGGAQLEIDHKLPVSLGGTNDPLNLVTACWDCNRGKGAGRIDQEPDPGKTLHDHQWETCHITVQMNGDASRQSISTKATRYGAGKSYDIVKPRTFNFKVSLPPGGIRKLPSLESYLLLLNEKDRRSYEDFMSSLSNKLKAENWRQVSKREWRRQVT